LQYSMARLLENRVRKKRIIAESVHDRERCVRIRLVAASHPIAQPPRLASRVYGYSGQRKQTWQGYVGLAPVTFGQIIFGN